MQTPLVRATLSTPPRRAFIPCFQPKRLHDAERDCLRQNLVSFRKAVGPDNPHGKLARV
jgi:hypothetical protein